MGARGRYLGAPILARLAGCLLALLPATLSLSQLAPAATGTLPVGGAAEGGRSGIGSGGKEGAAMLLRTLHRTVGLIFAPFFLLTAGTGALLLFRATGRFDGSTIHLLIGLHNWELAARYVGVVLAGALVFMSVTGLMLLGETYLRKRRARAAPRQG